MIIHTNSSGKRIGRTMKILIIISGKHSEQPLVLMEVGLFWIFEDFINKLAFKNKWFFYI